MNELQVKTINLVPAVVEFNFDELAAVLDGNLKKYDGLTFTDKDAASCKKTIAELNKGKKALNDYRISTKKDLTVAVTEFEDKCKELSAKFDQVINPLKDQHDKFEDDRKDEKRVKVQAIIDELIGHEGLNDKYAAQLVVHDSYLNKSTTLKTISEELTTKAEHLGIKQDKEDADIELIKSHVDLINERHGLHLINFTYINLLDFQPVDAIKERIERDAEGVQERLAPTKTVSPPVVTPSPVVEADDEIFIEKYYVEGTENQLNALEEYMNEHGLSWQGIKDA